MKSHTILLRPTQRVNHPLVQSMPPVSHLVALWLSDEQLQYLLCGACVQVTLVLLNMVSECQSCDAGD